MTAQEIIVRAMRWAGLIEAEEAATAAELFDGLAALNDMLFAFPASGIHYSHAELAPADTLAFTPGQLRAVRLLLASELAPEYGIELKPQQVAEIVAAMAQMRAAFPPPLDGTALGIVNRALRRLRTIAPDVPAMPYAAISGAASDDLMVLFNDFMHGLNLRGIAYVHTTIDGDGVVNMADEQIHALVLLLTGEMAGNYGVPLPPALAMEIAQAQLSLQAAYALVPAGSIDAALLTRGWR